jgi:hypothetical protein
MKLNLNAWAGAAMSLTALPAFAQDAQAVRAAAALLGASGASGVIGTTVVVVPPGGPTWFIAGAILGVIVGFALGVLFNKRRD